MMTTVTRSKLTIAAEIAAVGAFVIAVLAIVVTVFFDTGIRLPWNSGSQSQLSVVTSPVVTSAAANVTGSPSTGTTQPSTFSQPQPPQSTTVNGNQQSEPILISRDWIGINRAEIKKFGDGAGFWTLVMFALLTLVVLRSILWVLYRYLIPISLVAEFLTGFIPMSAIGYVYLWTFWSTLSDFGVGLFSFAAIVTAVYSCVDA